MFPRRVVKQAAYASGCGALVVAVGLGLVLIATGLPTRPAATPIPTNPFLAVSTEQVDFIPHRGSVDAVARLRNPNSDAGLKEYPVTFVLLNADDEEIGRHIETTYILPGSIQYVVATSIPVGELVRVVKLELPPTPVFTKLPVGLTLPNFGSFLRERSRREVGGAVIEEQKGIVRNSSTFDFQRVQVTALALDAQGRVVGVARTFVGELKVAEQREFTMQWPAPARATVNVVTNPSTNVFLEENIIRAIGDPSLLR